MGQSTEHRNIKVFADFCSTGIWCMDTEFMIEYEELNIPEDLVKRFKDFVEYYDRECTGRPDYCVKTEMAESLHKKGEELARELKKLHPDKHIEYWAEMPKNDDRTLVKKQISI